MNKKILSAFLGILAPLAFVAPAFPLTHLTHFFLPSGPGLPPAGILLYNPAKETAAQSKEAWYDGHQDRCSVRTAQSLSIAPQRKEGVDNNDSRQSR